MSGFSPEWLRLRESADLRARNRLCIESLAAHFALRPAVRIADLGAGAGANLRAIAPFLPDRQHWTLIDSDADLLKTAEVELRRWATTVDDSSSGLLLRKEHSEITVSFCTADLSRDIEAVLPPTTDLIAASALFDLVSPGFIRSFARLARQRKAAVYAGLTVNGAQRWTPRRPADNQMASAFHRHQMRDKGFGPAAGPTASALLADQLRLEGFTVIEGDSPWKLGRDDRMLIEELTRGYALAVAETGAVDAKTIESWVSVTRSGAETGHTDIFAVQA